MNGRKHPGKEQYNPPKFRTNQLWRINEFSLYCNCDGLMSIYCTYVVSTHSKLLQTTLLLVVTVTVYTLEINPPVNRPLLLYPYGHRSLHDM